MRLPSGRPLPGLLVAGLLLLPLLLAARGGAAAPAGAWSVPPGDRVPSAGAWAPAGGGWGGVADTVPPAEEVVRLLSTPGSREEGMRAIVLRAGSLPPARATLWVQLLATVERTGEEAGALAAQAVARADDRDPEGGVALLMEGEGGVAEEDRSALVALGAHLLAEREPDGAAELRRRLLREWPEALEAPEAQVELARHLLTRGGAGGREEALELLESLLVRRPSHPLAPEARRLRQEALQADPGTAAALRGRGDRTVELNPGDGRW